MPPRTGSPNKSDTFITKQLDKRLKEVHGESYDNVINMAYLCEKMTREAFQHQEENPKEYRKNVDLLEKCALMNERIAQFIYPKLKAIEVQVEAKEPIEDESTDDLENEAARLAQDVLTGKGGKAKGDKGGTST